MNEEQKMLALAKKVYPEHEWFITKSGTVVFDALTDPLCSNPFVPFDPANNSDQFVAVLAWLLRQRPTHLYERENRESWYDLSGLYVYKKVWYDRRDVAVWSVKHDGTAAGLRKAVTDAAMRVVG